MCQLITWPCLSLSLSLSHSLPNVRLKDIGRPVTRYIQDTYTTTTICIAPSRPRYPPLRPPKHNTQTTMTTMFREFSFEAASRHLPALHEQERAVTNVSPFSPSPQLPSRLPTPPPCSIGELAYRFDQHSLHTEVDPEYRFYEPLTPPNDHFSFPGELLDAPPQQASCYQRLSAASLRKQRQANTRMQCSPSHLDDISSLVQRMIETGDQCRICQHKSQTRSNASTSDDDEGVDMDFHPAPQEAHTPNRKIRRSGERLSGGTAVSKNVRMRRKSAITKRLSE
ncbi:hypothetical protein K504DRAFT_462192 [Pleomassaria siparia CBS 279.74]|uniref:Uncharacterized protein n=1 Tax=Pleomassaria siparia CBS 279.74 TaxID=1314801 RepID=A0A6G1KM26_9PLEO|nr:hypothetical protein K504DRAFT_462192 [Pleomassaria siparia CBS 279.74]